MGTLFHGPTPWILLFVVLLLFGAPKLPALAKSLGQSMKILKKEVATPEEQQKKAEAEAAASVAEQSTVAQSAAEQSAAAEIAKAKAEAAAAKAEADALRAAAAERSQSNGDA